LAWTVYYMGRTLMSIPSGVLPWTDQVEGFVCPPTMVLARTNVSNRTDLFDKTTGLYNQAYQADFWCPKNGIPTDMTTVCTDQTTVCGRNKDFPTNKTKVCPPKNGICTDRIPEGFVVITEVPKTCPARAAASFWENQALQQTSGMDVLGGPNWGLTLSLTFSWILVYFIIFKGVASSGKVVYVTAILPYIALIAFFFRANTLDGAGAGLTYYLWPDLSILFNPKVWIRAATQIFYSLGVGFGALIAFSSYSIKTTNFVKQSCQVACINCGTSFFAGFVVFPILGYLCLEISNTNPCIDANNLQDLKSIGLSGTGLAFIAFPIAISRMPFPFFWAILFFVMLFCLGIDSQFAMVESVVTVLDDAGIGKQYSKATRTAILCTFSWFIGLIFVTKGGVYWFNLFDYYTCVVAMFFVCLMECLFMWVKPDWWADYTARVKNMTGIVLSDTWLTFYKFVVPVLISILLLLAFTTFDVMGARTSVRYPEGSGYLPGWSIYLGWFIGLLPVVGFFIGALPFPYTPESMPASAWADVSASDSNLKSTELIQAEEAHRY